MAFSQFNQPVTGFRRAPGSYVNGDWVAGASVALLIQASVQPASDKDLKLLPEGRREEAAYAIYSRTEIRNADIFVLFGFEHEVLQVAVWQNRVLPHYKAIAVRMQEAGVL